MTAHKKKPIDPDLGPRLRECRKWARLTQAGLGAKVGMTGAAIHAYESGTNAIPVARLRQLADVMQLKLADLLASPGSPLPAFVRNNGGGRPKMRK